MASSHPAQSRHRECAMCMEKFTSPRLLACFHTFCLGCLRQLAQKYEGSPSFPCPSCRTTIYIPAGGVEKFQVNFYIEAQVEGQYAKAATARTCEMCGKGSATHKCSDCDQFSCDACTEIHASIKATRSHTVLNLQHAQAAGSLPGLTVTKERYCKTHEDEKIRFFCTQCSAVICRDCKLTSHEGHACTDLSNKSAKAKSLIFQVTDRAHHKLEPMLRAALQNAKSHKAAVQNSRKEIESTLERRADELIKEIKGSLAKAKENLNREASHVDQTASICIDHMTQELTCFISFTEYAKWVAESGCDADVLEISNEMKQFFGISSNVAYSQAQCQPFPPPITPGCSSQPVTWNMAQSLEPAQPASVLGNYFPLAQFQFLEPCVSPFSYQGLNSQPGTGYAIQTHEPDQHASKLKSFTNEDWNTVIQLDEDKQIKCNDCSLKYNKDLNCCPNPQCFTPGTPRTVLDPYNVEQIGNLCAPSQHWSMMYNMQHAPGLGTGFNAQQAEPLSDALTTIKTAIPQFIGHVTRSRPLKEKEVTTLAPQNVGRSMSFAQAQLNQLTRAHQSPNQGTDVRTNTPCSEITSEIGAIQALLSGSWL